MPHAKFAKCAKFFSRRGAERQRGIENNINNLQNSHFFGDAASSALPKGVRRSATQIIKLVREVMEKIADTGIITVAKDRFALEMMFVVPQLSHRIKTIGSVRGWRMERGFPVDCSTPFIVPSRSDGTPCKRSARARTLGDKLSENAFKEMPTLANRWSDFRFSSGIQVYFWTQRELARVAFSWSGDLTIAATETSTTDVPVPYIWLDGYYPGQGVSSAAYEALANGDSDGDGFPVWQEDLLGTDPTNAASRLFATVSMNGGTPVFGWSHTNANIEAAGYRYAPKGRDSLDDGAGWQPFASGHRFFKVVVEPVAAPGE